MMDRISPKHRSWNMSRIRSGNTRPEIIVRSVLHSMGYRFRLHRNDLPGKPDIVLPKYRTIIFVHGCFWHRHSGCKYTYTPKSRIEFWEKKFLRNIERDQEAREKLELMNWKVLIVWECETRDVQSLMAKLKRILV